MIKKTYDFEIKQVGPESDRVLRFTGTSEDEDRDLDVLLTTGWLWDSYMKNPVFLAQHDWKMFPVGRTLEVIPDYTAGKTSFVVKFPTIEELSSNPATPSQHALFADLVYKMYKNKYLFAVSVGFSPVEREPRTASNGRQGWLYTKMEALELSAVSLPSNRTALLEARSKGIISPCQYKLLEKDIDIDLDAIEWPPDEGKKIIKFIRDKDEFDLESIPYDEGKRKIKFIKDPDPMLNIEGLEIRESELNKMIEQAVDNVLRRHGLKGGTPKDINIEDIPYPPELSYRAKCEKKWAQELKEIMEGRKIK